MKKREDGTESLKFQVTINLPAESRGKVQPQIVAESLGATVRHHLRSRNIHEATKVIAEVMP